MYFSPKIVYSKVFSNDESYPKRDFSTNDSASFEDSQTTFDALSRRLKWAFIYICGISLVIVFTLGAIVLFMDQSQSSYFITASSVSSDESASTSAPLLYGIPAPIFDCGSTFEEAQAKGCVFDYVSTSWRPAACTRAYTSEFISTSDNGQGYSYFADRDGTTELTHEELTRYNYTTKFYTTNKWHLTHCLYIFMRFYHAVEHKERISHHEIDMEHTKHCVDILYEALDKTPGWNDINVFAFVQYEVC